MPHGRGPNLLVFRTDDAAGEHEQLGRAIWDERSQYKGKITVPDNPISIADAAVYLKATQPDLGIRIRTGSNQEQFDAAVDLLKKQNANIGEVLGRRRRSRSVAVQERRHRDRRRPGRTR